MEQLPIANTSGIDGVTQLAQPVKRPELQKWKRQPNLLIQIFGYSFMTGQPHDHTCSDPHQTERYPCQGHNESPMGSGNSRILYRRNLTRTDLWVKEVWVIGTVFFLLDYML